MNTFRILGIDCATQPKNLGLCLAERTPESFAILETSTVKSQEELLETLGGWMDKTTLLALDSPLGWPQPMGLHLAKHQAGEWVPVEADFMFSRETDRFVRKTFRKRPMEVGADRIARTALSALSLLERLRDRTGLAMDVPITAGPIQKTSAIEVYPAATLLARGLVAPRGEDRRPWLAQRLSQELNLSGNLKRAIAANEHVMDALVCCLAGADFLAGDVFEPTNLKLAQKEGWIWIQRPKWLDPKL